jgi:energy-coupling factor transporter transmembrane protein EcfT
MGILPLILRISSSAGFIILILHLLGIRGLGISLRQMGVPGKWVDTLILTIIFIPVMSRELIKIMMGRESRIVVDRPRLRRVWQLLSTVVGEVIIKGYFRAYRLQLTLKARLINEEAPRAEERDIKNGDIGLLISSLVMIFLIIIFSAV